MDELELELEELLDELLEGGAVPPQATRALIKAPTATGFNRRRSIFIIFISCWVLVLKTWNSST